MKFSELKGWSTPRGNVTKLAIDGVTVWKKGTAIGSLAVGQNVYLNVNGNRNGFRIVHQGNPNPNIYDESCNGVWLLPNTWNYKHNFDDTNHDYENSWAHEFLNSTFLSYLDEGIRNMIKEVKIPYRKGVGTSLTVSNGSNGLTTKAFLLSAEEVDYRNSKVPVEGSTLSYFDGCDGEKLQFDYGSHTWFLRTPYTIKDYYVCYVLGTGVSLGNCTNEERIRPTFILPQSALIDDNFNIVV